MARSGFNDDQNNPRYNFVPHPVSTDEERGIAAVNKIVSRADLPGTLEICTATSPDPTLYGGGTWQQIGNGVLNFSDADYPNFLLYQDDTLTTPVATGGDGIDGSFYCQLVKNVIATSGYLLTQMFWTYTYTAGPGAHAGAVAGNKLYTPFPITAADGLYTVGPSNGSDIGGVARLYDDSAGAEYQGVTRAFTPGGGVWWLTCEFPTADDPIAGSYKFAANDQVKFQFSARVDLTPI